MKSIIWSADSKSQVSIKLLLIYSKIITKPILRFYSGKLKFSKILSDIWLEFLITIIAFCNSVIFYYYL